MNSYNPAMAKEKDDDKPSRAKDDDKPPRAKDDDEATADDEAERESVDLEPVKTKKKGEPSDNLRRRAEWFQKRTRGD